jgi:hypothetical protein
MRPELKNPIARAAMNWPKPYMPAESAERGVESGEGLGDKLHRVLGPIGRAIHWPCMKGDGTTDLKPATLCFYLRQTFNKI